MPHEVATVVSVVGWLTSTFALPLKSVTLAVAVSLDKVAIVYVVVTEGVTVINNGLSLPEKPVPSDKVPDHGPCPVNAMLNCVEFPAHKLAFPLICPVGTSQELTITAVAADVAEQPALLVTVTV